MRTSLSTIVVATLATLFLAGCQGETATTRTVEAPSSPGKIIYDQQCSICHGKTGKGDTMIAASYPHANLTDKEWGYGGTRAELIRSVTDGIPKTPMRGFKGALSEKEIEDVVTFVLELSGS
jgi:cytochrome c oxidase cbb3-type subunit 3